MARRSYKEGPVTTTVIGTEEVMRSWTNVNDQTRVAVRQALTELTTQLRDRARALAPVRTGGSRSIRARIFARIEEQDRRMKGIVQPFAPHSHLLEFGVAHQRVWVRPYELRRKNLDVKARVANPAGKVRKRIVSKGMLRVEGYYRPFHVDAQPFMAPAYESMRGTIVTRLQRALAEGAKT